MKIYVSFLYTTILLLLTIFFINFPTASAAQNNYKDPAEKTLLTDSWQNLSQKYPNIYYSKNNQNELSSEILADWWNILQDKTLTQLIHLALNNNKTLAAAQARVQEARAQLGIKKSILLPWLDLNGSWTRSDVSQNSPYPGLAGFHTDYQLGIDAAWEIDVFGRQKQNIRAAAADLQAQQAELYATWLSLSAEIAANYISLRALQQQVDILTAQIEAQKKLIVLLDTNYHTGLINNLPVVQANYTLTQLQASRPELNKPIAQSMNRLAILTGTIPGQIDNLLLNSTGLPQINPQIYCTIPVDTIRQRPDIHAAERHYAAQLARTKSARSDLKPKISLFGSLGWESASSGSLFNRNSIGFSFGPQISLPFFHAGAIKRNIAYHSEKEKEFLANYENTILLAISEVRSALSTLSQDHLHKIAVQSSIENAALSLKITDNRYKHGLSSYQNVLQAKQYLLAQQEKLIISKAEELTAMIKLFKALGGGWEILQEKEITQSHSVQKNQ